MTPSLKKLITLGLLMTPLGAFAQPGALTEVGIDSGRLKGSSRAMSSPSKAFPLRPRRWVRTGGVRLSV